jgi:hypothetical protein
MAAYDWLVTLDSYANSVYGRPVSSSIVDGACVCCGKTAGSFTSAETRSVYLRSALCERCQRAHESLSDWIVPFNQNYRDHPDASS